METVEEKEFKKYKIKGAYHWDEISPKPSKRNLFVYARYFLVVELLRKFGLNNKKSVLDVGCGDGVLCGMISKDFSAEVTGVDNNELAINLAQKQFKAYNLKGSFLRVPSYELPFPNDSYDFITCTEVIEHVAYPEKLLLEAKKVLKKDGILILTTPIRTTEMPMDSHHCYEWFPVEFKQLCEKNFTVIDHIYSHPTAWLEFSYKYSRRNRVISFILNSLSILGINVFLNTQKNSKYKFFSLQTIILTK